MSEQQPKFHPCFHKFLIYFALWAFPLFGVAYGVYYIEFARENAARYMPLIIILAVLLILVSLFTIKVRFDLAAFRPATPKELLIVCLASAAVILLIHLALYYGQVIESLRGAGDAAIFAIWGFVLYRYYNERSYLFKD